MNPTSLLENFYRNSAEREAVKQFMIDYLKEMAAERAFEGKGVVGIAEANELIGKSFNRLAEIYDIIKEPVITNSR